MHYTTVLFDLDHTLFDSDTSEVEAYAHTMAVIGLDDPDHHFDRYVTINREMWRAVEMGTMRPDEVRFRRFEQFVAEIGIDADPVAMAEAFVWGLGAHGELYAGAREVLDALTGRARLGLVTNGLSEVQRARIERLDLGHYFDAVVISSEVGVTKPRREIFDLTFDRLGSPDPATALMVGDSLSSDIRGGRDYGIDTCWFNQHGVTAGPDDVVTHEIRSLGEILDLAAHPGGGQTPSGMRSDRTRSGTPEGV
jgi:YjjG family noncanonical pyrimidine nucleotidase